MFRNDMKLAVFLLFITFGLTKAAPYHKCLDSFDVHTKLDHHKLGFLLVDKIVGKHLNAECLKNVEFSSIIVAGLENYRICAMNKNLKLIYPSISVKGRYKAPFDPMDTTVYDEDNFTMELTDLIVNFLINDDSEDIEISVQYKSGSIRVDIPTNESLMKCLSSAESLIPQEAIKHLKNELKTVIDETWVEIGANKNQHYENSAQNSVQTSLKNKTIVFYYSLLRFLYSKDNT